MVYESATVFPDARGCTADLAAADLDVRLPEARVGVLREGRLGAIPAPLHDRAAVQLRGHRRAPGGPRYRRHERQREARAVARRSGPRAQGAQGPGPAPHPRRGQPGPPLHLRRRPGPRDPSRDGVPDAINDDFNLSTAASTTVLELAEAIWRKINGPDVPFRYVSDPPFEHDVQLRVPDVRKAREVLGSRPRRPSTRCSTRSSPGSATELEAGRLVTNALNELYEGTVQRSRGQREGSRSGARSSPTSRDGSIPTSRSSTSPAIAATSSAGSRAPSAGRSDIRDMSTRAFPPTSDSSTPSGARTGVAPFRLKHFGTMFMSNYLEHLVFARCRDRATARSRASSFCQVAASSCCNRTFATSGHATGTSSIIRSR